MNKQKELDKIAKEIERCKICKEGKTGIAVPGEGDPNADIVFVGEAPGKTEAKTGRPFVGRSGQLLRSLIAEIGLKEKDVFITSPVKYLPKRGTPSSEDITHGRQHLMKQLAIIDPKVVILLGRVAAEGVLQRRVPDGTRQSRISVTDRRGEVIEDPTSLRLRGARKVKYFLTYHPAAALRFPQKFKSSLRDDFLLVKKELL